MAAASFNASSHAVGRQDGSRVPEPVHPLIVGGQQRRDAGHNHVGKRVQDLPAGPAINGRDREDRSDVDPDLPGRVALGHPGLFLSAPRGEC